MNGGAVVIRAAGGAAVGLGHVRRCLTLAAALMRYGVKSHFLIRPEPTVAAYILKRGWRVVPVHPGDDLRSTLQVVREADATVVIVDTYDIGREFYRGLRERGVTVVAIDDLADSVPPADIVVNGSPGAEQLPYRLEGVRLLVGPRYALIQPDFACCAPRRIAGPVERILITVGGGDPHGLIPKVVRWTARAVPEAALEVVVGPLAGQADGCVQYGVADGSVRVHHDPDDLCELVRRADLAVTGGGQTACELAAAGTPAVAIQLADNQRPNLRGLEAAGCIVWAGQLGDSDLEARVTRALRDLVGDPERRAEMSRRGAALIDGRGSFRVAEAILCTAEGGVR